MELSELRRKDVRCQSKCVLSDVPPGSRSRRSAPESALDLPAKSVSRAGCESVFSLMSTSQGRGCLQAPSVALSGHHACHRGISLHSFGSCALPSITSPQGRGRSLISPTCASFRLRDPVVLGGCAKLCSHFGGVRQIWVLEPCTSSVTVNTCVELSGPQLFHPWNGNNNSSYFPGLLSRLSGIRYIKFPASC